MITSLLVMMVCVILVAAATQLAIHSTQRSGLSRNRTATLHAAEAGIEAALSRLAQSGGCPIPTGSDVPLPDQNLPAESYQLLSVTCPTASTAVVVSAGYVPNAARAVASTTLVAHVNLGQGAPVSGSGGPVSCAVATQCGYVFPDAIFAGTTAAAPAVGGTITAATPNTLSAYGTGGTVPNIVGNGAVAIAGTQLDGLVHGWSSVSLNVAAVGGEVVGNGVAINGATIQAGAVAGGSGGVVSSSTLALSGTTVNGKANYCCTPANYTATSSTVTGGATSASTSLPPMRYLPTFADSQTDMRNIVGVATPAATTCPGTGTGSYYVISLNVACTYNPTTINGPVVIVVHGLAGGVLNVNVPQTTTGAQLYVIAANGLLGSGNIIINGTNSTVPVFAYSDGTLTVNGGITGQLVANAVVTNGPTTLTFSPPAIPAPDFAFNSTQASAGGLGYAATVAYQYQCPGAKAC